MGAAALADPGWRGQVVGSNGRQWRLALKSYGVVMKLDYAPTAKRVIRIHGYDRGGLASRHLRLQAHVDQDAWTGDTPVYSRQGTAFHHERGSIFLPYSGAPYSPFAQYGQSGTWVAEADCSLYAAKIVDDLCFASRRFVPIT